MTIRRITNASGKPGAHAKAGRPNTINLDQRALDELLNELDDSSSAESARKRDFLRWPFRQTSIRIRIAQSRGIESELEVACRNISCGGASVLHSSYIHPGSKVSLRLPLPAGGVESVEGVICRCCHVRGVIHEIGIKFGRRLDVGRFLPEDDETHRFSLEKVDPETLQGTVVHVDDSPMDRRLVQHYLRGTQIRLRQTDDVEEAIRWVMESCDMAFIDVDLGPGRPDGFSVVKRLRESGCQIPIVALTSDAENRPTSRADARVEAMLPKPITQEVILRALAEFILLGAGSGPMHTSLSADHPNLALMDGFIADVRSSVASLRECIDKNDHARCRSICAGIVGTAPAMGFAGLASAAEKAVGALNAASSVAECAGALRTLLAACDRIRPHRTAA